MLQGFIKRAIKEEEGEVVMMGVSVQVWMQLNIKKTIILKEPKTLKNSTIFLLSDCIKIPEKKFRTI